MRRHIKPFNGKRYVLNASTGEIHDLDNEQPQCRIDEINPEHIFNEDDYDSAVFRAVMLNCKNPNGCFFCNRQKDKG